MAHDATGDRPAPKDDSSERAKASGPEDNRAASHSADAARPQRSLLSDLIRRRIPQVLAGYLGVTWTLFEFMKWLTNQYLVSPYLGQALLFGLLLFVPSVVLVTYRHGRPGPDAWTQTERVGIAGNAALVAIVLLVAFGGTELGSMVRAVEGGRETSAAASGPSRPASGNLPGDRADRRTVPKKEFRRRVAVFYFREANGARADTALRRMVPAALQADLAQDLFVSLFPPDQFDSELRERGYGGGLGVPLGLKQDVAQRVNAQYVLSGRVGRAEREVQLTTRLRKTTTGKQVAARTFAGDTLFALIDRASRRLKQDLGLPAAHLERATDLPVTQVFTASVPAAKHYAQGHYLDAIREGENRRALASYRQATAIDSTFATAQIGKGRVFWELGQREKAAQAFRTAQRHSYRLPETRKYWLKALRLLRIENRPEAALRVCEQWTTLYPHDVMAWVLKGVLHDQRSQPEAVLESYRQAITLAPEHKKAATGLIRGLLRTGRVDSAVRRAESFVDDRPRDGEGHLLAGTAHWMRGDLEEAEAGLRRAQGLDAPRATFRLVALHQARGRFEEALSAIQRRMQAADGDPRARFRRWYQRWLRGEIDQSIAELDTLRAQSPAPSGEAYPALTTRVCEYYDGLEKRLVVRAYERLQRRAGDETDEDVSPHRARTMELALAHCGIAAGRLAAARRHLSRADSMARTETGRPGLRSEYLRARLREKQGAYRRAAQQYDALMETWSVPARLTWTYRLPCLHQARAYQQIGQAQKAEAAYRAALTIRPADPRLNLHYGRFLARQGRDDAARTHLQRAVDAWVPADPDFRPKQRAQAWADSLGGASV